MESEKPKSKAGTIAGWIISGLMIPFLLLDGAMKLAQPEPVVESSAKFGITPSLLTKVGVVLLSCTILYAVPRTAVLGAILLTGYLGGAIATHVVLDPEVFPIVFASGLGVLVWLGLALRKPSLFTIIFG